MAELKSGDFTKTASKGPFAGLSRLDIVKTKIKKQRPFVLGANATGRSVYGVSISGNSFPYSLSYTLAKNEKKNILTTPLNKVYKDEDFGGGGSGSGGGADFTSITESGQCYYCSYAFNVIKGLIKKPPVKKELEKGKSFVSATKNLDSVMSSSPEDWVDTYIRTANELFKNYRKSFSGPVYFHRGSKFMNEVYKAKAEVLKEDIRLSQKSGKLPQAPGSFSNDKWNPGDIWMSNMKPSEQPLDTFKSWSELNQSVLQKAGQVQTKQMKLLGVSLKKLGGGIKVQPFNLPKRVNNISVPYGGFIFGRNGDFFSSIDMYMSMGGAEVQFRAFNSTKSWQGEIKGLSAAGGKIGGGNVNYYCEKHMNRSIGLKSKLGNNWSETPPNRVDIEYMYSLYKKYNEKQKQPYSKKNFPTLSMADFKKKLGKNLSLIFSKNMCLLFLDTMMSGSPKQRDQISTEIIRYAASNTDISSFFVKVY